VTNGDSNTLSIVNLEENNLIAQLSLGELPQGLVFSEKRNELYVANMYQDKISIIDCTNNSLMQCIDIESCPSYVLLSQNQDFLYVSNSNMSSEEGGFIAVVDLNTKKIIKRI